MLWFLVAADFRMRSSLSLYIYICIWECASVCVYGRPVRYFNQVWLLVLLFRASVVAESCSAVVCKTEQVRCSPGERK
jgi:hypothetical protein